MVVPSRRSFVCLTVASSTCSSSKMKILFFPSFPFSASMASRKGTPASPSRLHVPSSSSSSPLKRWWLPRYFSDSSLNITIELGTYSAYGFWRRRFHEIMGFIVWVLFNRYHLTRGNRVVHWITTITSLLAAFVIFGCFPLAFAGKLLAPNPSLIVLIPLLITYGMMSFRVFVRKFFQSRSLDFVCWKWTELSISK